MSVTALGYMGFNVSDLDAWHKYNTEFLGMMPGDSAAGSPDEPVKKYRIDDRSWRFGLVQGDEDDVSFLGFETEGPEAFTAFCAALDDKGVSYEKGDDELVKLRDVKDLIVLQDPLGIQVEVYWGPTDRTDLPFSSTAGVSGFLTGDQGAGHLVLATDKIDELRSFYMDVLGFKQSDTIGLEITPEFTVMLEFFHCNPRHHTLAMSGVPMEKKMHHFMLETNSLDDVGYALDRVEACGVQQTNTLGKHTNDEMISFYSKTPSGFEVEYGWGGLAVDEENWTFKHHKKISSWGHKPVAQ